MPKSNLCTAKCRHLRSFRYGFDNSRILAPYNGKDKIAGCALRPAITIHLHSVPTCAVGQGESR